MTKRSVPEMTDPAAEVAAFDRWSSNIHVGGGVYTVSADEFVDAEKLRRVTQVITGEFGPDLHGVRAADLGALEGAYSFELAGRGADVVAVEYRPDNLDRLKAARSLLGLDDKVDAHQRDVRHGLSDLGEFDVVLCLGLLYHLEMSAALDLLGEIGSVAKNLVVVDTHVCIGEPDQSCTTDGVDYFALEVTETPSHRHAASTNRADWLTEGSIANRLDRAGFSEISRVLCPAEPAKPDNRVTIVARKRERLNQLLTQPLFDLTTNRLIPIAST